VGQVQAGINLAVDHMRQRRWVGEPRDGATSSHEAGVLDRIQLKAAMTRLSRADRLLLAMRAAGLNNAEIGAVQGRSTDAIKMALHRALRRLRAELGEADED